MNADRRKAIAAIASDLESIKSRIEELKDEEQNYFDNMPESFQGGQKGEKAQSAVDALDEAENAIETVTDALTTATE